MENGVALPRHALNFDPKIEAELPPFFPVYVLRLNVMVSSSILISGDFICLFILEV